MFHTFQKFSKIIAVGMLCVLLSMSFASPAFASAPGNLEHWPHPGYYDNRDCQGYYWYEPCQNPCYQPYDCQGYQGYPYNQGCEGPGCPNNQTNSGLPSGTNLDSAQMLGSGSSTIAARAQQWYSFPVQPPVYGDNSRGTLNMDVTLTNLSGKATFQVLTSDSVNQWKNGVQYSPLGAGSESTSPQGQPILFWHGSFGVPLTVYVLVTNNTDQPATYTLSLRVSNG